MANCQGLFYVKLLGKSVYCSFVYFIQSYFAHGYMISSISNWYKWFSNRSIWPIDGAQIGTTTLDWNRYGGNGNQGALYTPYSSRTGLSPAISLSSHTLYTSFWGGSVSLFFSGYSLFILSPVDRTEFWLGSSCKIVNLYMWWSKGNINKIRIWKRRSTRGLTGGQVTTLTDNELEELVCSGSQNEESLEEEKRCQVMKVNLQSET